MTAPAFFPRRENIDLMEERLRLAPLPAAEKKSLTAYMLHCWLEQNFDRYRQEGARSGQITRVLLHRIAPRPVKAWLQNNLKAEYAEQQQIAARISYKLSPQSPHYFRNRRPLLQTPLGRQIMAEIEARTDWREIGGTPTTEGFALNPRPAAPRLIL